jgi:hypothetical protein
MADASTPNFFGTSPGGKPQAHPQLPTAIPILSTFTPLGGCRADDKREE